jgi:hypothetical protein
MDPNVQVQSGPTSAVGRSGRRARLRLPFRKRPEAPPAAPVDASSMSVGAHLIELRNRFFISIFSLVPGTAIGFLLSDRIIEILKAPPAHQGSAHRPGA